MVASSRNSVGDKFFPGSDVPFRPINPWGRKAPMPDGWKNPMQQKLYQVFVLDKELGQIPIGPRMRQDAADQFCAATRIAIKSGRIHDWANPTVLPAPAERLKGWALTG
jgi:hypothetical protein